ncbi:MAG: Asp23/Gls24 family envelope stress response protein [Coriobacteriales bacterium]
MKNALKSNIDGTYTQPDSESHSTVAHLGIAPGVVETMVTKATSEVPGVAAVGGPRVENGFSSVLMRTASNDGVVVASDGGHIVLDISIQIYYGYKLQDIVDGIRINVSDALYSQVGIEIDAINIYVSALQFEE